MEYRDKPWSTVQVGLGSEALPARSCLHILEEGCDAENGVHFLRVGGGGGTQRGTGVLTGTQRT